MSCFDIGNFVAFWSYPGWIAAREASRQGIPYIIAPHGTLERRSLSQKWVKKWLYLKAIEFPNLERAVAVRFTSEMERRNTAFLKLGPPSFIVPNGIDCEQFNMLPARNEARDLLGLPQDASIVAYIGRLHAQKGLDVLVSALAKARTHIPNICLVLAGPDDGYERRLRDFAMRLGLLEGSLRFLGYLDRRGVKLLLAASDVFAMISRGENFGMSVVEAMAAGVPVLISDKVGICREVEVDGAGAIAPVDRDAVARELIRLFSSPSILEEMGRRAFASARKRYDIRNIARLMARAYEDILTGQRSPECQWSDAG